MVVNYDRCSKIRHICRACDEKDKSNVNRCIIHVHVHHQVADVNAKVTIDLLCKRVEFEIGYIMPT